MGIHSTVIVFNKTVCTIL